MPSTQELRSQLLDTVSTISQTLDDQAAESERRAVLSEPSIEALWSSGLIGLKIPSLFGGHEADPLVELEVLEAAARANGAAGWCLGILTGTSAMAAAFLPRESAEEIFTHGAVPMAGAPTPRGKAEPKSGGYQLSGRWSFGSGIHYADWVIAGGMVDGDGPRAFILPRSDVELIDNWQVAGLKATGSCDYEIRDVFVPETKSFGLLEMVTGQTQSGGAAYRLGLPGMVTSFHMAMPLGIARRALDEITTQAIDKRRGVFSSTALADRGVFQSELGKAELELAAVRALAIEITTRAWTEAQAGNVPAPALQAELRGAATYVTEVAQRITTMAFHAAGGGGLFESNPLQRCFRDVHAAGQHFMVSTSSYQGFGQFRLGLPSADPML